MWGLGGGRGQSGHVLTQKILKSKKKALKCDFQHSGECNGGQKSLVFIQENVAFNLSISVTQSIPTSNEQIGEN